MRSDLKAPLTDKSVCPGCGADNGCGMVNLHPDAESVACWCLAEQGEGLVSADYEPCANSALSCYCSECLNQVKSAKDSSHESNP